MTANIALTGSYQPALVCLSVAIAVLAAYASLDLATNLHIIRGPTRRMWLLGGSVALGSGIWAMHYIGMEAFRLPIPVFYDWPTVLLSFVVAVIASGIALFTISRPGLRSPPILFAGCSVGSGIAAMHYLGMDAMRLNAMCVYSTPLVTLSIVDAILIATSALYTAYALRNRIPSAGWRKASAALLMGLAISSMHYLGMAAVRFMPMTASPAAFTHAVRVSTIAVLSIALVTLILLLIVFLSASLNRAFTFQEQQIAENQLLMQTIFDNMSEGLVVIDAAGEVILRNKAATRLLSLPENEHSYSTIVSRFEAFDLAGNLLSPQDWPSAKARRGEFVQDCTVVYRDRETGAMGTREISSSLIPRHNNSEFHALVTYRDTTQRWLTDQARDRLAAIVESSDDAIIGKDATGTITSWNKSAERIFGYSQAEMIGQSIRKLLPDGRQQEEDAILLRLLNGETVDHFETVRRTRAGKLIQVSLTISPIRDPAGKVIGASKIARDITEKRLLEQQLHQAQKLEAVGQLTGGIAHDFNNLLGVILGNLDLLERMVPDQPLLMRRVRSAQEAATRGADLTRRLLTFASHEELRARPAHLGQCISNVLELAGRALGATIRVTANLDSELQPVLVDVNRLESAVLNLMVNARDAMPDGGSLSITTSRRTLQDSHPSVLAGELPAGTYARLSISDTGTGMTPETVARATEPFFSTKARGKGTGLGLAMVYGFVKQSGGAMRIYSEVGFGTNIALYFPFSVQPLPAFLEPPLLPVVSSKGAKVLVVDDEEGLLEIASTYLVESGFHTIQARSGSEAIQLLIDQPDIVLLITDVILGGDINGVALVQKARQISPNIRCIYCSGFPAEALANDKISLHEGPLLNKPYQRDEFNAAVQMAMDGL